MYQERTYRNLINTENQPFFRVIVKETDLFVHAPKELEKITRDLVLQQRGYIEAYIKKNPEFAKSLTPWYLDTHEPLIIQDMVKAGQHAGVGPLAAVAGAIAEHVGKALLAHTEEVIIENGGDIFLKKNKSVIIAIFAGNSPLSMKIGLKINPGNDAISVCTSSGTVGHSLSFGKSDAVCVISRSGALADAAATSVGNKVKSKADISEAIDFGKKIQGVIGLVAIMGNQIGAWGDLEIVPITRKKG